MKNLLLSLLVISPTFLLSQCFISFHSVNVGACDPADNNFDLNGELQFSNPPATGQLIVEDCNGNQAVYDAPFTSPLMYTIPNVPSDGTSGCNVNAYFTADTSCNLVSPSYNNPTSCVCVVGAGTFTENVTGASSLEDPWYLCFGDILNISENGDMLDPTDMTPGWNPPPAPVYDPGLWLLVFSCPPYMAPPNDILLDSCFIGIASTVDGVWDIINNVGDGSIYWYVPLTMYSMTDGIYSAGPAGNLCYDVGPTYEVTNLEEIVVNQVLDLGAGTITVTPSGGLPAANGSSFTISNVMPATAVLSSTTVMNDSSLVISNLQTGQFYQYTLTDSAGCSIVMGDPDPFVGTEELGMDQLVIYPNPTTGIFNVQAPFEGELIVRDPAGRLVKEGRLNEEVDLSDQPTGIYFVYVANKVFRVNVQR